jgi:hypothetical protein
MDASLVLVDNTSDSTSDNSGPRKVKTGGQRVLRDNNSHNVVDDMIMMELKADHDIDEMNVSGNSQDSSQDNKDNVNPIAMSSLGIIISKEDIQDHDPTANNNNNSNNNSNNKNRKDSSTPGNTYDEDDDEEPKSGITHREDTIINMILNPTTCPTVRSEVLLALTRLPGGLRTHAIRSRVWPKLLGINRYALQDFRPYLGDHADAKQIECDVDRCVEFALRASAFINVC